MTGILVGTPELVGIVGLLQSNRLTKPMIYSGLGVRYVPTTGTAWWCCLHFNLSPTSLPPRNGLKTSLKTSPPYQSIPPHIPSAIPAVSSPPQHNRHLRRPHRNLPFRWPRLNLVGSPRFLPSPPPHEPYPPPIHPNLPSPGLPHPCYLLRARG